MDDGGLPVSGSVDGRPVHLTSALAAEVCRRVIRGHTLQHIERDPAMPAAETVLDWAQAHPEFGEAYERARELRADVLFDEAREEVLAATPETVWVARLRLDAIRWMSGVLAPRRYLPRVVAQGAIDEMRAECDPERQGLTVIIKRENEITPEEWRNAELTEQGEFDRPRRLR